MSPEIENFIKENINLIQGQRWDEVYKKDFPIGFTETLLDCGINPLEQGLDYVPDYFLYNCKSIKEFTIPDNVTSIGNWVFFDCDSLTSIEIPNSITSIGDEAFARCGLTSIVIPNSVQSIGYSAFFLCDSLTSIEIPSSVINIGYKTFSDCSSLKSITYKGTKKEALTILKVINKGWREGSSIEKIICNDGVIKL